MRDTRFQRAEGTESGRKGELERGDKREYRRETEISAEEGEQERGKERLPVGQRQRNRPRQRDTGRVGEGGGFRQNCPPLPTTYTQRPRCWCNMHACSAWSNSLHGSAEPGLW